MAGCLLRLKGIYDDWTLRRENLPLETARMRGWVRVIVVLAVAMVIAPLGVRAANDPIAEVKATIAEASPIFANDKLSPQESEQQLRSVAAKHFDFDYMARSAMGTHW